MSEKLSVPFAVTAAEIAVPEREILSALVDGRQSDAALAIARGTRRCLLVEIDQGSMPVERAKLHQTSILRKLLAYHQGFKQKQHVERRNVC